MKARLTNIFGLKLLPVSGEMTSTAKDMLDKEIEYIDYLRNRKKFFFMTQIQQTRVTVKKRVKAKEKEETKKRKGLRLPFRKRPKKKVKKKNLKQKVKQKARIKGRKAKRAMGAAGNKISAFTRNKTKKLGKNLVSTGKTMKGQVLKKVSQGTKFMTQGANKITKTAGALTKVKPQQVTKALSAVPTKTKTTIVKKLAATATKKADKRFSTFRVNPDENLKLQKERQKGNTETYSRKLSPQAKKTKTTVRTDIKSPKPRSARAKMRAKNEARFGKAHVDKLRAKNRDFQLMRKKKMTKAEFIRRYPNSQTAKRARGL